jgi:hypothetical protein
VTITEPYDTSDETPANGAGTLCAGCGVHVPASRKWCSEQCRQRHRDRDRSDTQTVAKNVTVSQSQDTWTFPTVVAELVDAGLVVTVNIEGIDLRLERPQP